MNEFLLRWGILIAFLAVQGVWGWVLWSLKKQFVPAEKLTEYQEKKGKRIGSVETDVNTLKHRMDSVEAAIKALPTVQGIHDLTVELERARGEMRGLSAEMTAARDSMKSAERQMMLLLEHALRGSG